MTVRLTAPLPRRLLSLLFAGVVAWGMAPGVAHAAAPAPTRAMWVWHPDDPQAVVSFAQDHGVTDLYVAVTPTVLTDGDLPRLQSLARLAPPAGITLKALGGDPTWVTAPQDALAWQRAALATGLFTASHVDIEPYALSGWSRPSRQRTLAAKYLDVLSQLQSDDSRPLEADVPFWYDTVASPSGQGTLADDVLQRVDAVTVMSYRDTATGILAVGGDMLQRADALVAITGRRVPVHLAAETNAQPDCTYCTFSEEGAAALTSALSAVDVGAAAHPAYGGMAVHDLTGWASLGP